MTLGILHGSGRGMATDPTTAYAKKVTAGKIIAGRLVRLACARHLADLGRRGKEARPRASTPRRRPRPWSSSRDFCASPKASTEASSFTLQPGRPSSWAHSSAGRDAMASGASASRTSRRPRDRARRPARGHWTLRARLRRRAGARRSSPRPPRASRPGSLFMDAKHMAENSPSLKRVLTIGEHNIAHEASASYLRPGELGGPEPRRQARPHGAHRRDS